MRGGDARKAKHVDTIAGTARNIPVAESYLVLQATQQDLNPFAPDAIIVRIRRLSFHNSQAIWISCASPIPKFASVSARHTYDRAAANEHAERERPE